MLRRISEPLAFSEASLLVLRPALNAPVLNVEFLPVGPARAAVVAFAEEYGGMGFALGIRSVESGRVVVFRNREPVDETDVLVEALEPVLATAERMGFLFDEDMLAGSATREARAQALALWGRLMGEVETPAPKKVAPRAGATGTTLELELQEEITAPVDTAPQPLETTQELVLEEVAPAAKPAPSTRQPVRRDSKPEVPAAAASASQAPQKSAVKRTAAKPARGKVDAAEAPSKKQTGVETQATTLSKFRPAKDIATAASDTSEAASELGRVALVKVRRGRGEAKRPTFLARLLSSF